MKLVRFGDSGAERPGIWVEEPGREPMILDVRGMSFDLEDYNEDFFLRFGLQRLPGLLAESGRKLIPAGGVRLGPPLARPGKIICLGGNYAEHVREFKGRVSERPVLFAKATSAFNGPYDPILLPEGCGAVDPEAELAVVIGRRASRVAQTDAMHHIAGYTILDDVTDRDAQRATGQWFHGKGPDTFCPGGPFLVTPDEVPSPDGLAIACRINGRTMQSANTADMLVKIPALIAYISATITLLPGDIISTGTPAGVGSARTPPLTLKPGDRVEVEIERLGCQINHVLCRSGGA